jgi:acyl carrier protein
MNSGAGIEQIEEIKDGLKNLIVQRLKLEIDPSSITDDAPLFGSPETPASDGLLLDSVESLEIVLAIEEKWGVVVEDDSVAKEFYSINTLSGLVSRLLSENALEEPLPQAAAGWLR